MPTKTKIKIQDDGELRKILDEEYENSSQRRMCQYSLRLARHILELVKWEEREHPAIKEGFAMNEAWQQGKVRMHEVRQASFSIHRLAKATDDTVMQTALRTVGQAVASGHMKEHAMMASDYAVKVVQLLFPNESKKVEEERRWQIHTLKSIPDLERTGF